MKILIAYIPVFHAGYKKLLDKHADAEILYIFGTDSIEKFDYLRKEIRAVDPIIMKEALKPLFKGSVEVLTHDIVETLKTHKDLHIIIPDEDVTSEFAETHFPHAHIEKEKIFLRWNRSNSDSEDPVNPGRSVQATDLEKELFNKAYTEASKASDFWLNVGALIVKEGNVLLSGHNRYGQSQHVVWSEGDPRNTYFRGVNIELTTSLHAERGLIAEAAKQGVSLDGASIYVTHFPCPTCAKLIACAGIKKVYYVEGYAVLDGQTSLEEAGSEIIKVEGIDIPERGDEYIPYPEKKKATE